MPSLVTQIPYITDWILPKKEFSIEEKDDGIVYVLDKTGLVKLKKNVQLIKENSDLKQEVSHLRSRLEEMEQVLTAIRAGEVDALMISGPNGESVYSLAGAEHPYRVMVESMGEGAVTVTNDGTILYANTAFARLLDTSLEQIIGSPFIKYVRHKDRRELHRLLNRGGNSQIEISLADRRGSTIPVYLSISKPGEQNASGYLTIVVTDLTHQKNVELLIAHERELKEEIEKRKQIEERLRESRNTLMTFIDSAPVGIVVADRSGRILLVNSIVETILGEKVAGNAHTPLGGYKLLLPDGDPVPQGDLPLSLAIKGQNVKDMELLVRRSDGNEVNILASARPLSTGKVIWGAISIFQDISERKRVVQELIREKEQSKRQLSEIESIYDSAPVGLAVFDRELRYVRINKQLAEMNGFPAEYHIGKTVREVIPEYAQFFEGIAKKILHSGEPVLNLEISGETAAQPGTTRYWIENWLPLNNFRGEVSGINVVVEEVTDHKLAEKALQKYKGELELMVKKRTAELTKTNAYLRDEIAEHKRTEKRLQKARKNLEAMAAEIVIAEERSRQRFAADLHDTVIQTLGAAKLRAELLRECVPQKGAELFLDLKSLLSQSIQESRQLMAELSPPVLNQFGFIPALEWLTEQFSSQNGLNMKFRGKTVLYNLSHEVEVLLFQSTRELLMNVHKHSQAKKAEVSVIDKGDVIRITVKDDGIGFHGKISFRKDKSGFGLFTIRERLRHLGGQLIIESKPNGGTRVTMVSPKSIGGKQPL